MGYSAHIVYDIKEFEKANIENSDLVITTCEKVNKRAICKQIKVILISLNTYRPNEKSIQEYKNKVGKILDYIKFCDIDLVLPNMNTLYRNWFYVIDFMIESINDIVKNNSIHQIFIYGGHPNAVITTLTLAEGETPRIFMYKRSWLFNNFIRAAFMHSSINVIWLKKDNPHILKIINRIRINIIYHFKILNRILTTLRKPKTKDENVLPENTEMIFLVRNPIQVEPLEGIYKEAHLFGKKAVFAFSESYLKKGVRHELVSRNLPYINLESTINIKDIFNAKKILKIYKRAYKDKKVSIMGIEYLQYNLINDLTSYMFDEILRIKSLSRSLKKVNSYDSYILIHNETYNYRAAIDSLWANKNNYPIYSIQHVAMEGSKKPVMIWQDRMYMMTNNIADVLNKQSSSNKFRFLGPGAYDSVFDTSLSNKKLNNIAVFTQTDGLTNDYLDIIDDLIMIRKGYNLGYTIRVKLHPRETNVDIYLERYSQYQYIDICYGTINTNQIIQESDLAISIYSGVIFQSIIIGTPIISVNYNKKHKYSTDYIEDKVTLKAYTTDELINKIVNFKEVREEFFKFRRIYLMEALCNYKGDSNNKIMKDIINNAKEIRIESEY